MKLYAGFDAGTNGAVAVVNEDGQVVGVANLKRDSFYVAKALKSLLSIGVGWIAVEEVPFIPGQGNAQRLLSEHVGAAIGVACTMDVAICRVSAVTWQRWLGVQREAMPSGLAKGTKEHESFKRGRYKARKIRIKDALLALLSDSSRAQLGEDPSEYVDAVALALYARSAAK